MRKFIFGLVLFTGGCIDFAVLCIAIAIERGWGDFIIPFLFTLALIIFGAITGYSAVLEEQGVPSPEEQNDKPAE